ncbi:MAG: trehalose-phosphatase [Acidimicrobiales bacterium]
MTLPEALAPLARDLRGTAVLTDFDGTLAAIVPDPADAVAVPGAVAVLGSLARRAAVVAIVSGRPVSFLAEAFKGGDGSVALYGGYGLEWMEDGHVHRAPALDSWIEPLRRFASAARSDAPSGVRVEDKGWGVTLHWRQHPAGAPWAERFATRWAAETGLSLQHGRMAVELRPGVPLDKGTVVERLAARCRCACFFGDDAGDLAAFDALDRLAATGVTAVRVVVADAESPPELLARADVVLEGPAAAVAMLGEFVTAADQ